MKDGLYHVKLGLPSGAVGAFLGVFSIQLSDHARRACQNDRYGVIDLVSGDNFEVCVADVVEIEIQAGAPVKAVVRAPYDDKRDIVLTLNPPQNGQSFVRTVWFNLKSDAHRTLDRSKYIKP